MAKVVTAKATGSASDVASNFVSELQNASNGETPVLSVVFASTHQPLAELLGPIKEAFPSSTVIGSSTAGEFTEDGDSKEGAVLWTVFGDEIVAHAGMGRGLKENPEGAIAEALPVVADDQDRPYRTAVLLLDPLSGNGEAATMLASAMLGPSVRLAGGAAGDDLKFEAAEVGAGSEASGDAVVIALLQSSKPLGIGVEHGHAPISGPMTVTKADGAVVQEIDGKPAFDVWRDAVRERAAASGVDIDSVAPSEIGAHLLRYELGMIAGANQYKIRAPLSVSDGGGLSCACGLPEGAVVRVTESIESAQVASARGAAERARQSLGNGSKVAGALVFDCICRNLILGDEFGSAVREISSALGDVPLAGFETYGEIAMDVGQMSGFHNTTTVVLAIPE